MLYNTEKLDFKLFFCSRNSRWLQASLDAGDIKAGEVLHAGAGQH